MIARIWRLLVGAVAEVGRVARLRLPGQRTHAIQQRFAIPTYFSSDASGDPDWSGAVSNLLGIVVINPASGPGYTPTHVNGAKRDEFQARIDQMHAAGADVVGYVTTNYRDSRDDSVQGEHGFTVEVAGNIVTTDDETGWTSGFGPIQVRADVGSTLAAPLAVGTDYFWIKLSDTTGRFATSSNNAQNGVAIPCTSAGGAGQVMGSSRTLANISNVFSEVDAFYSRWTGIDGMFFDEMNDVGDADDQTYYGQIYHYVKAKGGKGRVIQNPGNGLPASMLGVADVFITFEGPAFEYPEHAASLETSHAGSSFWHAIYACPVHVMPSVIAASRQKNASYVYVTERSPVNQDPWRHLAAYFRDEVHEVRNGNSPGFAGVD